MTQRKPVTVVFGRPLEGMPADLSNVLKQNRASLVSIPLIERAPVLEFEDNELKGGRFDLTVFSSSHGVERFEVERSAFKLEQIGEVACVGQKTAMFCKERLGISDPILPEAGQSASSLFETLEKWGLAGKKVLVVSGSVSAFPMAEKLEQAGAEVRRAVLYSTTPSRQGVGQLRELFSPNRAERFIICLFSPSGVEALRLALPAESKPEFELVSVGPTTSNALRQAGFLVAAEAEQPSSEAVLKAAINLL